jgi:hypothetical protein
MTVHSPTFRMIPDMQGSSAQKRSRSTRACDVSGSLSVTTTAACFTGHGLIVGMQRVNELHRL